MSIAGGLALALERGRDVGCGSVQLFLRNQRRWAAPPLRDADVREFAAARRATDIRWVFAHGSYLINLAASDGVAWGRGVRALTDELERAEALGLLCVVMHPGSHLGAGVRAGIARAAGALDAALAATPGYRVRVALENTAGAGDTIGRTLGELGAILARVRRGERVGVCLDTCHLFAAGYDIREASGWRRVMTECAAEIGMRRVLAFHLNDARSALGSGLDRHEHIGRGGLGLTPFALLLNDRRFARVPKVLETPKEPEPWADRRNLAKLRALRPTATSSRRRVGRAP
jgi:deoxyribonuclease-4